MSKQLLSLLIALLPFSISLPAEGKTRPLTTDDGQFYVPVYASQQSFCNNMLSRPKEMGNLSVKPDYVQSLTAICENMKMVKYMGPYRYISLLCRKNCIHNHTSTMGKNANGFVKATGLFSVQNYDVGLNTVLALAALVSWVGLNLSLVTLIKFNSWQFFWSRS